MKSSQNSDPLAAPCCLVFSLRIRCRNAVEKLLLSTIEGSFVPGSLLSLDDHQNFTCPLTLLVSLYDVEKEYSVEMPYKDT
jgi:hypothetical protein